MSTILEPGMQDVVSTALRYIFLQKLDSGKGGPLLMDEPARMTDSSVSKEYGNFLKELSKTTGKQIIICTHSDDINNSSNNIINIVKD